MVYNCHSGIILFRSGLVFGYFAHGLERDIKFGRNVKYARIYAQANDSKTTMENKTLFRLFFYVILNK